MNQMASDTFTGKRPPAASSRCRRRTSSNNLQENLSVRSRAQGEMSDAGLRQPEMPTSGVTEPVISGGN
jgi:hypothetical protein